MDPQQGSTDKAFPAPYVLKLSLMSTKDVIAEIKGGKVFNYLSPIQHNPQKKRIYCIEWRELGSHQVFVLTCNQFKKQEVLTLGTAETIVSNCLDDGQGYKLANQLFEI